MYIPMCLYDYLEYKNNRTASVCCIPGLDILEAMLFYLCRIEFIVKTF